MMFQNPPEYQESDSVSSMSSNVSSSSDRNDDTINNLTAEFRNVAYSSDEEYNSISSWFSYLVCLLSNTLPSSIYLIQLFLNSCVFISANNRLKWIKQWKVWSRVPAYKNSSLPVWGQNRKSKIWRCIISWSPLYTPKVSSKSEHGCPRSYCSHLKWTPSDLWSSFSSNTFMIKSDMSFFFQQAKENILNKWIYSVQSFLKNHHNGRNTTNGKCTFWR